MKALPAVDLREGACVQLVGGDFAEERVRVPDAVAQALDFSRAGFDALHVVDLDAATGRGDNSAVIERLSAVPSMEIQVGGGVRDEARIESLLGLGVKRVIVGTRAVLDRAFREDIATRFPDRIVIALDVRGTEVVVKGWQSSSGRQVGDLLAELDPLPIAGVLVTAVHLEGRLQGTDQGLFEGVVSSTRHPVHASGGVSSIDELRALEKAGCRAAVIGMALYTARIDPRAAAKEFSRW